MKQIDLKDIQIAEISFQILFIQVVKLMRISNTRLYLLKSLKVVFSFWWRKDAWFVHANYIEKREKA